MDKFVTFITSGHDTIGAEIYRTEDMLIIRPGRKIAFKETFTNPLKTIDNTVGEMNRKNLHDLLDEWIDCLIENKFGVTDVDRPS